MFTGSIPGGPSHPRYLIPADVNCLSSRPREWPASPVPHYDRSMIPGFSGEMIFIFFLALILFGPKKMPEIGRQVARFLGEFRRASNEFRSQIESEINSLDNNSPKQQILPPLQAPLGSLANRIFNPPRAEQLNAAEDAAAEAATLKAAAAESVAPPVAEPAPKATPDA
jgi:TatA/E family protein of Tat protein translocase